MSMNNQSRSLIIMAKAQGYDPTKIYDPATKAYVADVGQFDQQPTVMGGFPNRLSGGPPNDADDDTPKVDNNTPIDFTGEDKYSMTVGPFRRRASKPSDPFAGKGGTAL